MAKHCVKVGKKIVSHHNKKRTANAAAAKRRAKTSKRVAVVNCPAR